jgi:hypothetical protein
MSLKDLQIPQETVEAAGDKVVVRGLNLQDFMALLGAHGQAMSEAFSRLRADAAFLAPEEAESLAGAVLHDAPELAAHIIARAAGEPEMADKVMLIAAPDQLALLEAVARLTFRSTSPKKVFETVIRISQGMTSLVGPTT